MVANKDLWEKCRDGKVEEVREALARGADPNSTSTNRHDTLLMTAASYKQEELVDLLLAQPGIEVNKRSTYNNITALHIACASGSNACLMKLLAVPGIDVNALDKENGTPMMWAVNCSNTEAVRLMAAVANLDRKFPDGQSLEER